jgi:hypothetical protein
MDKRGFDRLMRIAHVRGVRLARTAETARRVHDAAVDANEAARQAFDRQQQHATNARALFATDPACPQAKLWLTHTAALRDSRAQAASEAADEADAAASRRAAAVSDVLRHDARARAITERRRQSAKAERMIAETAAERDAPPPVRRPRP